MVAKNEHTDRSSCLIARGLDVIGDHWTLLIIRDLMMFGRHEFSEFLEAEEGISSNILTDRLRKLQDQGLVDMIPHPESRKRKLYFLTPKGKDLIHVIVAIGGWSAKHIYQNQPPPEFEARIKGGPKQFIQNTLAELNDWEESMGIKTQSG